MCASCTHAAPAPHVSIAPAPVVAHVEPVARAAAPASPFAFVAGRPIDALREYAVHYWGPGGESVFTSPASVRAAGDLTLVEVGRYAVVEVPGRDGFFLRDFGENGFTTELGGTGDRVVVRYTIRDDGADSDWSSRIPEITSVAHMILEIWSFADRAHPRVVFAHEYEAWANCCGSELGPAPPRVSDDVEIQPNAVRLRAREAWRATRASWHETPLPGIAPVIAPWDEERDVTFDLRERSASSRPL